MRIGLFLIVLVGCLVALGYFASDSVNLHQDIQSLNEQLRQAQVERAQLEQAFQEELQKAHQDIQSLSEQLRQAQTERAQLGQAFQQEATQRKTCEQSNQTLENNATILLHEISQLQSEKTVLSQQLRVPGHVETQALQMSLSGVGGFTIVVLALLTCRMRAKLRQISTGNGRKYVQLSKEELTWLIGYRRSQGSIPSRPR